MPECAAAHNVAKGEIKDISYLGDISIYHVLLSQRPVDPHLAPQPLALGPGQFRRRREGLGELGRLEPGRASVLTPSLKKTTRTERPHANVRPSFMSGGWRPCRAASAMRPPIYAKRAKNAEIWSEDGKRYIDFAAGIAVVNTGHQHPKIVAAVEEQLKAFSHVCFQVTPYESYVRPRRAAERARARRRSRQDHAGLDRRGSRRERGEGRARLYRPPGDRLVQRRLPRPHAYGHGADRQGRALQEGLRAVPRRRLQCRLPQHLSRGHRASRASPR